MPRDRTVSGGRRDIAQRNETGSEVAEEQVSSLTLKGHLKRDRSAPRRTGLALTKVLDNVRSGDVVVI